MSQTQESFERLSLLLGRSVILKENVRPILERINWFFDESNAIQEILGELQSFLGKIKLGLEDESIATMQDLRVSYSGGDDPGDSAQKGWLSKLEKVTEILDAELEQQKGAVLATESLSMFYSALDTVNPIKGLLETLLCSGTGRPAPEEPETKEPEEIVEEPEAEAVIEPKVEEPKVEEPTIEEPEEVTEPEPAEPAEPTFVCPDCQASLDNVKSLRGHCSAAKHKFPEGL